MAERRSRRKWEQSCWPAKRRHLKLEIVREEEEAEELEDEEEDEEEERMMLEAELTPIG
jgi:hypothetical protein